MNTIGRVLIIDDDNHHRQELSEQLSGGGYEVAVVSNSSRSLGLMTSFQPEVVVFGPHLPGFARAIAVQDHFIWTGGAEMTNLKCRTGCVPIIAICITPEDVEDSLLLGLTAHIEAPYEVGDFLALVGEVIHEYRGQLVG